MERVNPFHPEALEKGIKAPIILEPFVLPADAKNVSEKIALAIGLSAYIKP